MTLGKIKNEREIVLTPKQLFQYFDSWSDGAESLCAVHEDMLRYVMLDHGFGRYDDVEIVLSSKVPVDRVIEEHIELLMCEIDRLGALYFGGRDKSYAAWKIWELLYEEADSEPYYVPEYFQDLLDLFQVEEDSWDLLTKHKARIEKELNEFIDQRFK